MTSTLIGQKRKAPERIDRCATQEECKFVLDALQQDDLARQDTSPHFQDAIERVRGAHEGLAQKEDLPCADENSAKRMLHYIDLGVDAPLNGCSRCKPEFVCRDCIGVPLTMCTACRLERTCGECTEYDRRAYVADRIGRAQTRLAENIVSQIGELFDSMRCGEEHSLFLGNMLENGAKVKASTTTRASIRAITKQRVNRSKLEELKKKRARRIMEAVNTGLERMMFSDTTK